MSQENTVSFKVFLQSEHKDAKPEVRRFGIDRDVVSNFTYLSEKLRTVFPALQGKLFSVSWRDEDGDDVLISSDDELMIALTEIKGDVRKLHVVTKGDNRNVKQENPNSSSGKLHPGVLCDECESSVTGFRYKCIECPNYDLCSNCEAKESHSEHFMIRLPVPVVWRPNFGKRLAHNLSKSAHKHASRSGEEAAADGKGRHCPFVRPHASARGRHVSWVDVLATYLGEWVAVPPDDEAAAPEAGPSGGQGTAAGTGSDSEQKQKPTESAKANGSEKGRVHKLESHAEYLMHVGKAVASFLDPLGIDVDVSVDTPAQNVDEKAEKQAAREEHSPASSNTTNKSDAPKADRSSQDGDCSERESPEKDGWTVVSGETVAADQTDTDGSNSKEKTDSPKEGSAEPAARSTAVSIESAQAAASAAATAARDAATAASAVYEAAQHAAATAPLPASAPATGAVPKVGFPVYYPPPPSFSTIAPTFPTLPPPPPTFGNQWSFATPAPPFGLGGAYAMMSNNQSRQHSAYPQQQQQQQPPPQQQSQPQRIHPQQQQQQQQQQQPLNQDPRVAQALQAMMAMGFSNEGGWLTQLLEMKEGDIEKALDVLQPVKKN